MLLLRKVFFYLFFLLYLIICPLIILRMLGFVHDDRSGHWVKTGMIYVSSNPPGAALSIDGRKFSQTTPAIIRDLLPGSHVLAIDLKDHDPWEQTIPVLDKKATSVENILLLPKKRDTQTLSRWNFEHIWPLIDNSFVLAATSSTVKDLHIISTDTPQVLFPSEFIYRDAQLLQYFDAPHSPFLVLHLLTGEKHKYLWVDPHEKSTHIEDISDLLPPEAQFLFWEANDDKNLFVLHQGHLNRINIKSKAIYPKVLNNILTATIYGNDLYALTNEWRLIRCDLEGNNKKDLPINFAGSIKSEGPLDLYILNDKTILLRNRQGTLALANTTTMLVEAGVKGTALDIEHNALLIWTTKRIGILDLKTSALEWVLQGAANIQQAFWANNGSAIIYRSRNDIFIMDRESFTNPRRKKILTVKDGSSVYFSEKNGKLYYIDANTRFLNAMQILHHRPFIPKPIAETLRLKKFER